MILSAFCVPSFSTFSYYFILDVVGLSKFTISMLGVLGFVCLFFGTLIYRFGLHN